MSTGYRLLEELAPDLIKEGLVTEDQLAVARVSQESRGEDLGQILVQKGFVTEDQLLSFLGKSLSIPYLSLESYKDRISTDLIKRVPVYVARRHHLIPLCLEEGKALVAMVDPLDRFAIDDVQSFLEMEVKPVLASVREITHWMDQLYGIKKGTSGASDVPIEMMGQGTEEAIENIGSKLEEIATVPKVVQTVNQIILEAYQEKASDIHIDPFREFVRVRYRVDGLLEERLKLGREMLLPVVSRIKIMAGIDIAERRVPQDGRMRLGIGGNTLDLRVSSYPTLYGEKMVLRLLSKDAVIGIESLGFSDKDRKVFGDLISRSFGIFLVTGPTGSGKSTTLYAALSRLNSPEKNIISIEDPVESEIRGISQAQVNAKAGVTFASALRAILRQDPDIIMIGEIRDKETAEIAVRSAITGHLVLSTLHTNTAAGVISRLMDLGVEPFLISSALIGVMAQRLVRKICVHCRRETEVDPSKLGPFASYVKKSFRGQGCAECRMSGFSGRIGIFELAPMTEEPVRRLISAGRTDHEIEEELRRLGMSSIFEDGLEKVNQGVTTVDEILRATQDN